MAREYEELKEKYTAMLIRDNYHEVVCQICLCCKHCQGDETVSGLTCSKYTLHNVAGIEYNGTCDNWEQSKFYGQGNELTSMATALEAEKIRIRDS